MKYFCIVNSKKQNTSALATQIILVSSITWTYFDCLTFALPYILWINALHILIKYSYIFSYRFCTILPLIISNGIRILIIWTLLCIWYNPCIWLLTFVLMVVLRGSSSIPTRSMMELFVKALKDCHKELLDMANFLDLHLYLKNYNFSFPCKFFVVWDNNLFLQFVLDKMKGSTIKLSTERRKADKKMTRSKTWKSQKPQKSLEKQLNKVIALSTNTK